MSFIPDDLEFDTEPEVRQAKKEYQSVDEEGNLTPYLVVKLEYYLSVIEREQLDLSPTRETWIWLILEFASLGPDAEPYFMRVASISDKFDEQENLAEFEKAVNQHKGKRNIGSFFFRCNEAGVPPYSGKRDYLGEILEEASKPTRIQVGVHPVETQIVEALCAEGELGAAKMLHQLVKNSVLFNHTSGQIMLYNKGAWREDTTNTFLSQAPDILKAEVTKLLQGLYSEMAAISKDDKPALETMSERIKPVEKTAVKLNQLVFIRNVLRFFGSIAGCKTTDFDVAPDLFNCANVTFDLSSLTDRPHSPKDMLSKRSLAHYDKNATCEKWIAFNQVIFQGDKKLTEYAQKIFGLCLTGRVDHQCIFFLIGAGSNGKSTFVNTLAMLTGEFFVRIPSKTLMSGQKSDTELYQMASLKGARVVLTSELSNGQHLNESLVKDLSGGDAISARNPCEKPFVFNPTHKLLLMGNHRPQISGTDHGIWRRIREVPFNHKFPELPKDGQREMSEVLQEFREELSGILNWAIEGFKLYKNEKLDTPPSVKAATDAYKESCDTLGPFLEEECMDTLKEDSNTPASSLFKQYLFWCDKNEQTAQFANLKRFNDGMRAKGYTVKPGGANKTVVYGIKLKLSAAKPSSS